MYVHLMGYLRLFLKIMSSVRFTNVIKYEQFPPKSANFPLLQLYSNLLLIYTTKFNTNQDVNRQPSLCICYLLLIILLLLGKNIVVLNGNICLKGYFFFYKVNNIFFELNKDISFSVSLKLLTAKMSRLLATGMTGVTLAFTYAYYCYNLLVRTLLLSKCFTQKILVCRRN